MNIFRKKDGEKRSLKALPGLLKNNTRLQSVWAEYGYLLLCMIIPAVVMYLIYLARGEHPFGNGCVLVLDLNGQYVWFFEALRNFVHGDAELLYSFSRALGGEFLGIYAYYLASPLSFLVCLFPQNRMLEALLALFLLKCALCGGTFGYYMHKTLKDKSKLSVIAFSCFYALSSYAVVQQHNTMWIDAVMWLPLITLGIESVIKHGKFKLYTVSLAIALFSNYYIGYMLCIYCLIYFFVYYFAHTEDYRNNPLRERFHFWRSLGRMAGYSILAVGIAAVIIFAAYYSLNFGKTTFSNPDWEFAMKFDMLEFLYKLLPGSYDTVRPDGLPFVYCGMLTLLLIPSYFLSKKYPMQQKIFSGILLLILFASFSINIVDLVWHGFQNPNWLNYRYSCMFSFYLCVLACRAFADFENVSLRVTMGTGGLIALFCVILQKYGNPDEGHFDPNDFACIYFSLILIFAYIAALAILRKSLTPQVASAGLLAVIIIEVFLNGLWNISALGMDVGYSKYSYYNDFLNKARPIVEEVQEKDDSFYRMEKTFFRKTNDNMALGMRGLSGSTSTLNKETIKFLNKMGYSSKSHWSKYLGGTPVSDSLLGLKYVISDDDIYQNYYDEFATDKKNGYTAYLNPYALSIAYAVDEDVLEFPLGFVEDELLEDLDENGEVKEKSALSKLIGSLKEAMNEWLNVEETKATVYEDHYDSHFERLNAMVSAMLGEEETLQIFVPVSHTFRKSGVFYGSYSDNEAGYSKETPTATGTLTCTVEDVPVSAEIFFYAPTDYPREVDLTLTVNDGTPEDFGTFNGNESNRIISLGMYEAGDYLELEMTLTTDNFFVKRDADYFYYIDWAVFEDAMERLAEKQFKITDYTESSFEGTFTAADESELLMTTIPYDNGWQVFVDGERVEITKAFGALLAFHIEGDAGEEHEIRMVYSPKTITVGLIISLISIAIFILLLILDRRFHFGCKVRDDIDYDEETEESEDEKETDSDEDADKAEKPEQIEEAEETEVTEEETSEEENSEEKNSDEETPQDSEVTSDAPQDSLSPEKNEENEDDDRKD